MSYEFEKLVADQLNPSDVTVIFRKSPEKEFGVEWPASRFEMPASDLAANPDMFVKLVKKPAPQAVHAAVLALKDYFSGLDKAPDYLAEITTTPSASVVVPFARKVA